MGGPGLALWLSVGCRCPAPVHRNNWEHMGGASALTGAPALQEGGLVLAPPLLEMPFHLGFFIYNVVF